MYIYIYYIYIYIFVQNTSKTYHYSLFHPEGIFSWSSLFHPEGIFRLPPEDSLWKKQTVVVSF